MENSEKPNLPKLENQKRLALAKQIAFESKLVADDSLAVLAEFEQLDDEVIANN